MSFLIPEIADVAAVGLEDATVADTTVTAAEDTGSSLERRVLSDAGSGPGPTTPAPNVDVDIVGAERLMRRCDGIAWRLTHQEPVMKEAMNRLEKSEEKFFGDQYVDTGRLRDSLTNEHAEGAIRRVLPTGAVFGSSIYYAPFQVEDPGPITPAGGLVRHGHPSAILKVDKSQGDELTVALGEYVMGEP